jgi:pyruvate dehydrogenase E2 component (dihydrolipoamide acetyltransferase)
MSRRRDAVEVLSQLVRDPRLVSRTMIEDVLRYKRLDGVQEALKAIAAAWFPNGQQRLDLRPLIENLVIPAQVIWGRDDRILPAEQAGALTTIFPVHILDGAGHLPHLERAAEVGRLLAQFIESASREPFVRSD